MPDLNDCIALVEQVLAELAAAMPGIWLGDYTKHGAAYAAAGGNAIERLRNAGAEVTIYPADVILEMVGISSAPAANIGNAMGDWLIWAREQLDDRRGASWST